ncbi:MAG: ChbG/HpnK family deacetylase [Phycisphaerales bacterium]|nr:ChbG/HpnK family deacetylase [Phycisphaerales bacterium]MCB9862659.1 ChbG/HpnK family deacetylase [Phycisphaerales bacterium]
MESADQRPPETRRSLIVHADDLGLSQSFNDGIRIAATQGHLTSTCIRVNGTAYDAAVGEVIPACPNLGVGLHLNIVEGRSTRQRIGRNETLCDADGAYRHKFVALWRRSGSKQLRQEIEADYRDQIERALGDLGAVDHLNSHQHSHGIPAIFEIVCRLAREYGIPFVRVPREKPHVVRSLSYHLHDWYAANLVKIGLLNTMAIRNRRTAARHGVATNDWFVGIGYTGFMNSATIRAGLAAVPKDAGIVELLLHPCAISGQPDEVFLDADLRDYVIQPARREELRTLCNDALFAEIASAGWNKACYRCLSMDPLGDTLSGDPDRIDARAAKPTIINRPIGCTGHGAARAIGETAPASVRVSISPQTDTGPSATISLRPPLRAFIMLDETPFHHPAYLARLINECEHLDIVGAAVVHLPGGGPLQRYMIRQWRQMGVVQFGRLGVKSVAGRLMGRMPTFIRGNREGSVRGVCRRYGIPYRVVSKVNTPEFHDYARSFDPDVIVSSCTPIFKRELLNLPNVACINRHSSLLPTFGGILPVFRAVQMGEKYTGASVHRMTPEIDGGEVLSRKWLPIFPGDTLARLYQLCFVLSFEATYDAAAFLRNEASSRSAPRAGLEKSYFSYPTREDWKAFADAGGRFI